MKNARPQQVETSAKDTFHSTAGILPTRRNTVLAGVLAELLEGHTLTSMDAVFKQYANRAATVIHCLEARYAWNIERRDIATAVNDGRVVWVTAYWMTIHVREAAFKAGARAWIQKATSAANKRRKSASHAKSRAAKRNLLRADPRQLDLFDAFTVEG
ncbi:MULTISPECIES: hypothetical protein [Paraburkholderia]|uniref:Uncharacterized protein n=1 Tax=Paraburkholderia madseniana TaxID=2599607 RepID=A0AAP5BDL0_9BURK|nr:MULTISPECIES: hypothetical protein [Paraburkholderia]MCX4146754.1 hypothetical protein [Paraburkholderia madseniana]MDN7149700.1 hypothetical protein [Paraburkholderia sp. WS6]MDQ6408580.1 hypothetical protein [Paraburkholderia madseniana]